MASTRHVVLFYHGIHYRVLTEPIEKRLFRNSICKAAIRRQFETVKNTFGLVRASDGENTFHTRRFYLKDFRLSTTFDDGYKNNFKAAEIIYELFGVVPLTIFLTTGLVGSNRSIWTVEFALLALLGRFRKYQLEFDGQEFAIGGTEQRLVAFNSIRHQLKQMNAQSRRFHCETIQEQALAGEIDRLLFEYPEFQMLNLDEIKQMQAMGVRFQPHGHNHEIFHAKQDPDVIKREIIESKEFIEKNLNEKCTQFAYPNGDYCESAISILKENEFTGAYTTKLGVAETLEGNFEIPRITPSGNPKKFRRQLRGKLD